MDMFICFPGFDILGTDKSPIDLLTLACRLQWISYMDLNSKARHSRYHQSKIMKSTAESVPRKRSLTMLSAPSSSNGRVSSIPCVVPLPLLVRKYVMKMLAITGVAVTDRIESNEE